MQKKEFFVDFHCHSTLRAFNSMPAEGKKKNIWEKTQGKVFNSKAGRWASLQTQDICKSSQSNFYAMARGKSRVIIDSLYPIEKNWLNFRKLPAFIIGDKAREEIIIVATGYDEKIMSAHRKTGNYFSALLNNYEFLEKGQGSSPNGEFSYKLVSSYAEMHKVIQKDPGCLAVIPSIEGGHAFGCGMPEYIDMPLEKLKKNLTKNITTVKQWKYPPFYTTLAHHFWNQLCGHCRSFKHPVNIVYNQSPGINRGITKLGWHVIRELLTEKNGKRILIDVKHMSMMARRAYYRFITDCNYINQEDKIPIICSHAGISSYKIMLNAVKKPDNNKKMQNSYLNNWSINLTDEEIKIIHASGGLIGIMLDKFILGSLNTLNKIKAIVDPTHQREAYAKLILDNIFAIIKAVDDKTAWDIIVMGTDFDGLISYIDCYKDAECLPELKSDLINYLYEYKYKKELWYDFKPEEMIEKLMTNNGMEFLKIHFK